MIRAIDEPNLHILNRVPCNRTRSHRFNNTLAHRIDILSGDVSTNDLGLENQTAARLTRLDFKLDVTVLTTTTRLPHETTGRLDRLAQPLFISHLRLTNIGFDLEFAKEAVDENFEMQFAHTRHHGLTRFIVEFDPKGRILFTKLGQGDVQLLLISPGFGLNSHVDHRFGELDLLKDDRILLIT